MSRFISSRDLSVGMHGTTGNSCLQEIWDSWHERLLRVEGRLSRRHLPDINSAAAVLASLPLTTAIYATARVRLANIETIRPKRRMGRRRIQVSTPFNRRGER